ncbi:hypothetical protein NPIL_704301 [Nephila pilipes]|uniref:Uncharacterized protein n=1 Tax=Nephila pilipes TaxID=299642 RepID=A0A8X6TTK2_NEPPI|nr:hypothetical protein NPIL_704301 [Nephila pilipes]
MLAIPGGELIRMSHALINRAQHSIIVNGSNFQHFMRLIVLLFINNDLFRVSLINIFLARFILPTPCIVNVFQRLTFRRPSLENYPLQKIMEMAPGNVDAATGGHDCVYSSPSRSV